MEQYLAFDIGGTAIKYGIISSSGEFLYHSQIDTEANLGGPSIIRKVIKISKDLLAQYKDIKGVAISSAGQIDVYSGTVIGAGDTIPNYVGLEIKNRIENAIQLPVEVRNDVECAALCEKWLGGHEAESFITLTIGTGIGGAIIINGDLYTGHSFSAGEVGYMLVEGEQFEKAASVSALIEMAKSDIDDCDWTGEEIFQLYDSGDDGARKVVHKFYKYLGIGLSNLIYIFNPEKIVLGGGITGRGEQFLSEVREVTKRYTVPNIFQNSEIVLAKYSNQSGMLGAVYHFIQMQKE